MIRYRPGFVPQADAEEKVPTCAPKTGPTLPSVEKAKALATGRQTQVLAYTRAKTTETPLKQNLRTDGPTLEQWLASGYLPQNYPPTGYAELPSPALTGYKAALAATAKATSSGTPAPHSITTKPGETK